MAKRQNSPAFWTKIAAAADKRLSNSGFRLLCLLLDRRGDVRLHPDDDFGLTWREAASWIKWDRNTTQRALQRIVSAGYLVKTRVKGCPPETQYRLAAIYPNFGANDCAKNGANDCAKNGANDCAKNGASHTSNSFQEGSVNRGKEGSAAAEAAGERMVPVSELGRALAEILGPGKGIK
ncbi:MAG: hypothetical protein DVB31_13125 [Verrucomicrobia bacterium]|nr:MAG: hypothetical protein DVB31_13125 [Verrucomicrobiota bacterium]